MGGFRFLLKKVYFLFVSRERHRFLSFFLFSFSSCCYAHVYACNAKPFSCIELFDRKEVFFFFIVSLLPLI